MKAVLISILLCSVVSAAEQPASTADVRALTTAIDRQQADITKLAQLVERLTERVALLQQLPGEAADVPEIAIQRKTPGQWLMHPQTGIPVYARSQWHSYFVGKVKVIELIKDGITPVPVGAVTFEGGQAPSYPADASSPARIYQQSQRLRP